MLRVSRCAVEPFRYLHWPKLAEVLPEHYPAERVEALAHLDFAIAEFREMKMQPSLEKALKLNG